MKIIRMTKTMSGPSGTFAPGMVRTVDDTTAAMLIGAEAAVLAPGVAQPAADNQPVVETVEEEAAAVEAAPETATTTGPRKRVKK